MDTSPAQCRQRPPYLVAGRIVVLYLLLSGLWILTSDRLLLWLTHDPQQLAQWSTAKGLGFVALTGAFFFVLIHRAVSSSHEALKELNESRSLLQAIVEGTTDAVFAKDADGRYILLNQTTAAFMGTTPEAAVGQRDEDFFPAEVATSIHEIDLKVIGTGQPVTFEETITTAGGQTLTMLTTKGPMRDGEGMVTGLFGIARDITARKRDEEELRLFKFAIDRASESIFRIERDGDFTYVNDQACRSLGYSRDELLSLHLWDIDPEITPETWSRRWELIRRVGNQRREIFHRRKDGSLFPAELSVNHLFYGEHEYRIAFARDISERQKAEAALRASESKFRALVEQSITGIYVFEQDRFLYVNRRFAEIFGYVEEEVLDRLRPTDVIAAEDRAMAAEMVRRRLSGEARSAHYTARGQRRSGERIWVEIHGNRIVLGNRTVIAGTLLDISERVVAEEELRRHQEHLEELVDSRTIELEERNADLEAFSYSVSHDLRAPLRAIVGFADILERRHRSRLDEEGKHYLGNIILAAERMGRLIDDLLSYARLGRRGFIPQPVSLAHILLQLKDEFGDRLAAIGAELTVAAELPTVVGGPTLLRQVFANLIDNALLYCRPDVPPRVIVSAESAPGEALIRIADNGIGIPPEHREKIFHVFQRLHGDDVFPGTGIGLATARKALSMMGGKVELESSSDSGSTFCVRLPLAE